jgi:signal transduction histidine kinase
VLDDGPGIAEADRSRVFDRFTRLDAARDRDAGGSGLGLAIVRELVSRAGGTVSLAPGRSSPETPEGPGLRAVITLPRPELELEPGQ